MGTQLRRYHPPTPLGLHDPHPELLRLNALHPTITLRQLMILLRMSTLDGLSTLPTRSLTQLAGDAAQHDLGRLLDLGLVVREDFEADRRYSCWRLSAAAWEALSKPAVGCGV